MIRSKLFAALLLVITITGSVAACSDDKPKAAEGALVGLFTIAPGKATSGKVSGSWFRMVQPGGSADKGPYMPNEDSPAQGGTTTLLEPGSAGGLLTGSYQSEPKPGFYQGNSRAGSIMKPTRFFGVGFGTSTNPVDPQTRNSVIAPTITTKDGKLKANLSAWAASWNNQEFNQGAPKAPAKAGPQVPGVEQAKNAYDWVSKKWFGQSKTSTGDGPSATGTYQSDSHAYTLEWTSLIVGGPFNGFTGVWHLTGLFTARQAPPVQPSPNAGE